MACKLCEMKSKTILEMNLWNEESRQTIEKLNRQVTEYQKFIFDLGVSMGEQENDKNRPESTQKKN